MFRVPSTYKFHVYLRNSFHKIQNFNFIYNKLQLFYWIVSNLKCHQQQYTNSQRSGGMSNCVICELHVFRIDYQLLRFFNRTFSTSTSGLACVLSKLKHKYSSFNVLFMHSFPNGQQLFVVLIVTMKGNNNNVI